MKLKLKKMITIMISFLLIFSMTIISFAETADIRENDQMQTMSAPRWVGLITVAYGLDEDPVGYVNPYLIITADTSVVNSAQVTVTLQQYSNGWKDIKTWNETVRLSEITDTFSKTYKVEKGYSYRYNFTVKAGVDKATGTSDSIFIR